uniref:Uncharacterized protein n=1 Tax=Escherichia coli TaxID=562 RepID=Q5DQE8_ECOLX|nr:hypothetical protein [Escherichia coli]
MPDRGKQQLKTRFSTCKTEVVHRSSRWVSEIPAPRQIPARAVDHACPIVIESQ